MRRLFLGLVTLAALVGMTASVSGQTIGVVLMHGNTDSPDGSIAPLVAAIEGAGYLVERPEMCWSYRRRRDRPLLDCLAELEEPIARLTRGFLPGGLSDAGPQCARIGHNGPASETLPVCAPCGQPPHLFKDPIGDVEGSVPSGGGNFLLHLGGGAPYSGDQKGGCEAPGQIRMSHKVPR